eukprot:g45998.t1
METKALSDQTYARVCALSGGSGGKDRRQRESSDRTPVKKARKSEAFELSSSTFDRLWDKGLCIYYNKSTGCTKEGRSHKLGKNTLSMACLPARPREQNDASPSVSSPLSPSSSLPAILESSASHLSAVRVTTPSSGLPSSSGVQNRLSFSTPAVRARGLHCLSSSQRWINFWQPGMRPHGLSVCSLPDSIWKAWSSAQAADFALWRSGTRLSKTISSDSCNLKRKLARTAEIARINTDDARLRVLRWSSEPVVGSESPEQLAKRLGVPVPSATANFRAINNILVDAWHIADPVFLDLAVEGLLNGTNLFYEGPRSGSARLDNYSSATSHSEFVTASPPLLHPRIAPLGVVAKDESDLRNIIDLTAGGSLATNTCTPKLFSEFVRWESLVSTLVDAHSLARSSRASVYLLKLDVAKAFRLIPIRPMDWHLSVLEWLGRFSVPLRLVFGGRASPGIWERYGFLFKELLSSWLPDWAHLIRWVDDYLAILICSEEEARVILSLVQFVADRYGFPLKLSKLESPSFSMQFICWLFDVSMELPSPTVSVPVGKKERVAESARLTLQSPSFKALEKFLGKAFNFASVFNGLHPAACRVNAFKHMLPLQGPARLQHAKLPVSVKRDIEWLARAVRVVPSSVMLRKVCSVSDISVENTDVHARSDAGSSFGQGIIILNAPGIPDKQVECAYRKHTDAELKRAWLKTAHSSSVLEVFAVQTATSVFKDFFRGRRSDNLESAARDVLESLITLGAAVRFEHIPSCLIKELVTGSVASSFAGRRAPQLVPTAVFLIATGLAASTRETYLTCMRHYWRFCGIFNMWEEAFLPPLWLLSSSLHICSQPCVVARRTSREHPPLAVKMLGVLLTGKHCTESVMLAAIITTGIYALLRSGEMVVKADSSSVPLRREHVQWDSEVPPQWVDIFIEAAKTDFCREGATLRLHRNESISCPFTRLQSASGQPLSYSWLQSSLRRLVCEVWLEPALYGSHSLRIGGATSLAMIPGVTADIIKHMGRLRSLSYQLYVRVTNEAVRAASASLGRLGDAPRSQHRNAAGSASLFGGLAMESALQLSSDDIDDIVVRFQCQGGA